VTCTSYRHSTEVGWEMQIGPCIVRRGSPDPAEGATAGLPPIRRPAVSPAGSDHPGARGLCVAGRDPPYSAGKWADAERRDAHPHAERGNEEPGVAGKPRQPTPLLTAGNTPIWLPVGDHPGRNAEVASPPVTCANLRFLRAARRATCISLPFSRWTSKTR
jgi:hypothetical protein